MSATDERNLQREEIERKRRERLDRAHALVDRLLVGKVDEITREAIHGIVALVEARTL